MRSLYVACPSVRGPGGIAAYARSLIEAMSPDRIDVLGLAVGPEVATLSDNARLVADVTTKTRFAARLVRDYLSRGPTVFLFAHVGLTTPLALLPKRDDHRVVVIAHGLEVWQRLNVRRAAALPRVDSIAFTARYNRALFTARNEDRLSPAVQMPVIPLSAAQHLEQSGPVPVPAHSRLRCLCVSRLISEESLKGIPTLLRAAQRLAPDRWEIIIAGDGDARQGLERQARTLGVDDRVQFLGWVSDDRRTQLYAECDVFCLPSAQEGFGIVFLEAMVAGRPCVGAAAGAIPEVLSPEIGETFPFDDEVRLAQALERAADRSRSGEVTPESIRRFYERRYSWSRFRQSWRTHLDALRK